MNIISKVLGILKPSATRSDEAALLNSDELATGFNAEMRAHAKNMDTKPTKDRIKNTQGLISGLIKDVLWNVPLTIVKTAAQTVNDIASIPVKLAIGVKGKIEALPRMAVSGALVGVTKAFKATDWPLKVIKEGQEKIDKVLSK